MESEFREYVKIPKRCPAEDKGQLSKGLRGEVTGCPAVHLSSINGVTEDRAPLPLRPTVLSFQQLINTWPPGWLLQRGPILSDTLVTLSIWRLILLLHTTHKLHLAKEKQDLWMNVTLCHLCDFEFLLPFNKYLINLAYTHGPVGYCSTWYIQQRLVRRSLPSKNTWQGWEVCWHVAASQR